MASVDIPINAANMKRLHASVDGRVQGVSFRYFTLRTAKQFELTGWVRNRFNGSVELVAEGPEEDLNLFLDSIRRGPPSSQVNQVDHSWSESAGEFKKFMIRMTR